MLLALIFTVTRVICMAHAFVLFCFVFCLPPTHLIQELLPITLPQVRSKWLLLCKQLVGIRREMQ